MRKKIVSISIVGWFLLIGISAANVSGIQIGNTEMNRTNEYGLADIHAQVNPISEITLEDDAFHETFNKFHAETWYFDAVFQNGYSMATIVTIAQKGNTGSVLTGLYIYKDTELIIRPRTFYDIDKVSYSTEVLDMEVEDETIMKADIDSSGDWHYYVYEAFDRVSFELDFESITPGWKTDITGGWWLVNPRLEVSGYIIVDGERMDVHGEGYHDHNWFYANTPLMQKGWHFGNIAGDKIGLTWANVMQNDDGQETIAVINRANTEPYQIDPENVDVEVIEYMTNNGKTIPKKFTITAKDSRVDIQLSIDTLNLNYVSLPSLSYWRFHLKIYGTIVCDSVTQEINNVGIAELMKFSRIDDVSSISKERDNPQRPDLHNGLRLGIKNMLNKIIQKMNSPLLKAVILNNIF